MQSGYDIDELYREAQSRWLKPVEVLYILRNHDKYRFTQEPPQRPTSGSVFLFNKRVLRFFRRDGHNWRKKRDGRTVGEAHERLKVGNHEALNCYYAHGEQNPTFQRRSYWMLDPAYEHIVLVHYREISEGTPSFGSVPQLSPGSSSAFSMSPDSYNTHNPASTSIIRDYHEQYQSIPSPESLEVNSKIAIQNNGIDHLDTADRSGQSSSSSNVEVSRALRRLEEQLSLNEDSIKDIPFSVQDDDPYYPAMSEYEKETSEQNDLSNLLYAPEYTSHELSDHAGMQNHPDNLAILQNSGDYGKHRRQSVRNENSYGRKNSLSWTDVLEPNKTSSGFEAQENLHGNNAQNFSMLLPQEVGNFYHAYSPLMESHNANFYPMFHGQDHNGIPVQEASSLTVAQKQNFTIREISPQWGYINEATKVIVIGSFLCDPSESAWKCMFGDVEVPVQIIQEGVICCEAPHHSPGTVSLCITSGNRESCSEVREFEYRVKTGSYIHGNLHQTEPTKSPEELLLLVRFVQVLLSDSSTQKGDNEGSGHLSLRKLKTEDDSWDRMIESLLVGSEASYTTIDWLLEQLLKDKLQEWLTSRTNDGHDQPDCPLSKKEQGVIHMVAGLGFEWALNPIISYGVNIDFRDINGWTALHWAARFGREKMVAALIASGASPGAVTDPNAKNPTGRTPASIAASYGHKGLAGYLSELALTSHLSSLRLEESELSKVSAEVEAEKTVNSISNGSLVTNEDQLSLKDTLAAVRNATQAAARIQSAFRAHSFRRRQIREDGDSLYDEYGISAGDIQGLSAMSKLAFGNPRDYNSAALSIQKKYRGWKGRKDFLALRQKVVKIQAHVRGYQVRKHYKVICWAVGVLDKVVLRWRRKGSGLRGFHHEKETVDDNEDEDILKVFRKQKVDGALNEAVSRVLSMAESPEARQQYHRMLERCRQAKAELGASSSEAEAPNYLGDFLDMENDDFTLQ